MAQLLTFFATPTILVIALHLIDKRRAARWAHSDAVRRRVWAVLDGRP